MLNSWELWAADKDLSIMVLTSINFDWNEAFYRSLKKLYMGWIMLVLLIIALFFVVSTLYHFVKNKIEAKKYLPLGELIEVQGHKMHIYGKGEGKFTAVLTSGWGETCALSTLYGIFSNLSKETRTLVYDRPGYGWSESAKTSRATEQVARELNELLEKANEKSPYILVAHSMGSLEVLKFAQLYPEKIGGVVLIDAGNPEFYATYKLPGLYKAIVILAKFARVTGIIRLTGILKNLSKSDKGCGKIPSDIQKILTYMSATKTYGPDSSREMKVLLENGKEMLKKQSIGDIPLLILTAGYSIKKGPAGMAEKWDETQQKLLDWSGKSKRLIVDGVGHDLPVKKPEVVVNEILALIERLSAE